MARHRKGAAVLPLASGRMRRIPKCHVFPGGYTVDIVIAEVDAGGYSLTEGGDDASYDTLDVGRGQITLHPSRTARQMWRDLAHELLHALVDAQHYIESKVAP